MNLRTIRTRLRGAAALALLPVLALTACGSGASDGTAAIGAQGSPAPTDDPVATVRKVDSVAALLPADVRKAGTLRVGSSIGFPPGAYYPNGSDKAPAGQDAAVNELIKDGTYARILTKWGTAASAIDTSRINPAEHG